MTNGVSQMDTDQRVAAVMARSRKAQQSADEKPKPLKSLMKAALSQKSPLSATELDAALVAERNAARTLEACSMWEKSGLPGRHRNEAKRVISDAKGSHWLDAFTKVEAMRGFLVALVGHRGTGKTQMAACIARAFCLRGESARYTTAVDLFRDVRAAFSKDGPDERTIVNGFVSPSLLIIDEAQERGDTEFEDRTLVNIIDRRYGAMRSTILIANQNTEAFSKAMGSSIVSRINECGEVIVCDWASYRDRVAK